MPVEKGHRLLTMHYHEKMQRGMTECSLHQIDPQKIDVYADYMRDLKRKQREAEKRRRHGN
jgi:hypothetical protein